MIKKEKIINAKTVDFFNELTQEEKAEAELKASIAMAIHDKRIAMKMNQQEFAEMNQVSQTMVSKWESGEYNFTISNLSKILTALGIKIMLQEEKKSSLTQVSQTSRISKWEAASSGGAASGGYRIAASPNAV